MSPGRETPRVLVVDDTPAHIRMLVGALRKEYEILVATNGEQALELARSETPDIILLDIVMPGWDGYEVCRRLKSEPGTAAIPVIFITGKADDADELTGLDLGAVDYITKPFSLPIVTARVRTHLEIDRQKRELAQNKRQLERQNFLLSENLRLQEEVERMSRHDLKTPLSGILSIVKLLEESPVLGPREASLAALVERATYRVLDLVNLSLDLVRMERGDYPLRPRPVDLSEVLRRIFADLEWHAASKEVTFRLEPPGGEEGGRGSWPWALGEELLCYSMLANLVKNALEASPLHEEITASINKRGGEVEIVIHNRGAVPESLREGFFEKYRSGGKEGGVGLGTYSARLLAETQRGQIEMRTSEEEGTTLLVTLPGALAASAPGEGSDGSRLAGSGPYPEQRKKAPLAMRDFAPLRVLIIDDDSFNTAVLRACLPEPPLLVESAVNGRAGLALVETFRPDIIFLDLEMPVLGGVETVSILRGREAESGGKRAFVVGVSAHEDSATKERFMRAGCDRSIVRPAGPEDVWSMLRLVSPKRPGTFGTIDYETGTRRAGGDEALHRLLLGEFLEKTRDFLASVDGHEDSAELRRQLHTIKGTAATLGAAGIASLAARLEESLEAGPERNPSFEDLRAAVEAALGDPGVAANGRAGSEEGAGTFVPPLDPEALRRARQLIQELESSLKRGDLDAAARLAELEKAVAPRFGIVLKRLSERLSLLDTDGAAEALCALEEELRHTP